MNTIRCDGLDGSNPLHFLAALGLLRLISLEDAAARLAWSKEAPHVPVFQTSRNETECRFAIATHLGIRGSAALQSRRHRFYGLQEDAQRALETCAKDKEGKRAAKEWKETARVCKERIRRIDTALKDHSKKILSNCHPLVSLADCIHRIPQSEFRNNAIQIQRPLWRSLLPALAVDRSRRYKKDEDGLSRTRFSFSNGGSGKALLKDFCSSLSKVRLDASNAGMLGFSTAAEEVTGLMWEPTEQRNYALRWLNPTDDATRSVPILNVLAFSGLSFFPLVPATPSDRTTGFDDDEDFFRWPLWASPLHVDVVSSLLSADFMKTVDGSESSARGIVVRFQTEVIMSEKRNFFAHSRPV